MKSRVRESRVCSHQIFCTQTYCIIILIVLRQRKAHGKCTCRRTWRRLEIRHSTYFDNDFCQVERRLLKVDLKSKRQQIKKKGNIQSPFLCDDNQIFYYGPYSICVLPKIRSTDSFQHITTYATEISEDIAYLFLVLHTQ